MPTMIAAKTLTKPLLASSELQERRRYLIQKITKNAPKNVLITDEEIQEEVNMVRYGNKNGKPNRDWKKDLTLLAKAEANV
jgi:hypothetical protein